MNKTSYNHNIVSKRCLSVDNFKSSTKIKATKIMLGKPNKIIKKQLLVNKSGL